MRALLRVTLLPVVVLLALVLAGCSAEQGTNTDPDQVDAVAAPELGVCRELKPADVAVLSNATRTVDCAQHHTAETFAVGALPAEFAKAAYADPDLSTFTYQTCTEKFQEFLGAPDQSLVMRTVVSWAAFRPSEKAWDEGARWYRCDAVGGGDQSKTYLALPTTARDLLASRPEKRDRWIVCANGPSVESSPKVPCTRKHIWRAVGTIKVGQPADPYPGDTQVQAISKKFCSGYVGAWLGYPDEYDYSFTWFHRTEWEAGNRRSVCWAKTTQ